MRDMHIETERKFLVNDLSFKSQAVKSHRMAQGYVAHDNGRSVRIRISDDKAFLTIKGPGDAAGVSRCEWEKEVSLEDAGDLMRLCQGGIIDKIRYIIPAAPSKAVPGTSREGCERFFEVDEFLGDNEGLIMAEIELGSPDEQFEKPSWLGKEVTGDKRYYNASLSLRPFKNW